MRNPFKKHNPHEIRIPIRLHKNREYYGKTYYKRLAHIPTKLESGEGTFKLVVSKRAKYLLLNFESGGLKPKKPKKQKHSLADQIGKALLEAYIAGQQNSPK